VTESLRPAAFLDRDGTIIHDAEYLGDPTCIRLLRGATAAIARLNAAGLPVIVVTNQSGIARGLLSAADYERVRLRLDEMLAASGVHVDATMMCPHHPDFTGPCECRKPGVLLYEQAAAAHGLDLARSVYVGDRWRDVAPAVHFGGRGFLLRSGAAPDDDFARAEREPRVEIADSLRAAVDRMLVAEPLAP
jgi:D-glycero-D-manno-heptose 1,7-bisphosphate phosphatase